MAAGPWVRKRGTPPVPTNTPFGGGQSTTTPPPTPTPSPNTNKQGGVGSQQYGPAPAGKGQLKYAKSPVGEETPRTPGPPPAPRGGGGGGIGLIWALGGGLIVANLFAGDNSGSLIKNVFYPPDKQRATPPQNSFFPIIGEIIFLVILATLARFSDTARQLVLTFLIGLWLLWLMFKFPAVYKAGIAGTVGQLFSQGSVSGSSTTSTSQPGTQPAFGQPYTFSPPRQGGMSVGTVPHQVSIMG